MLMPSKTRSKNPGCGGGGGRRYATGGDGGVSEGRWPPRLGPDECLRIKSPTALGSLDFRASCHPEYKLDGFVSPDPSEAAEVTGFSRGRKAEYGSGGFVSPDPSETLGSRAVLFAGCMVPLAPPTSPGTGSPISISAWRQTLLRQEGVPGISRPPHLGQMPFIVITPPDRAARPAIRDQKRRQVHALAAARPGLPVTRLPTDSVAPASICTAAFNQCSLTKCSVNTYD